jgi:hypothetical protein
LCSGYRERERESRTVTNGPEEKPALLASYFYLKPFLKNQAKYQYRDWVLDSGAFSAHNSGVEIKNEDFIATAKDLLAKDPTLTEVFALDVIGDWRASIKNCEAAWKAGVPVIPCFHYGEPWEVLTEMAKQYPKIALGGMVGTGKTAAEKMRFLGQCFARVWPKKIHGFGTCSEKLIMAFPFHSVDATNWEIGPCRFGRWASFGQMSIRGSKQDLKAEVEHYLRMEYRARQRWSREMKILAASDTHTHTQESGDLSGNTRNRTRSSRTPDTGHRTPDTGHRTPDTGHRTPDTQ